MFCKGKTTKTAVKAAAKKYIATAVRTASKSAPAGGKAKAEKVARVKARKSANRILLGGCKVSSAITGKKKKNARKRKR